MATVLIVDDDAALREGLAETLGDLGHRTEEAEDGAAALRRLARPGVDAVLLDLHMPGLDGLEVLRRIRALLAPPPVAVLTAVPTAANTIEAMRLGAIDDLAKPVGRGDLAALLSGLLAQPDAPPPTEVPTPVGEMVGASAALREVQKTIGRLADSDTTVLMTGETGTGKEIVARALHRHGRRAGGPFVAVNCAAIPAELLESLLFGHVRGAFTGAVADRAGSFREADGGTLFLDEIGDTPPAMQAKLLRVLGDRTVTPVADRSRWMCGCSPRRIAIFRAPCGRADSGRTCSIGWAWRRCTCRRCGNGWPTSCRSPNTSWRCPPGRAACPSGCRPQRRRGWSSIPGPATSGNCATPWSASRPWCATRSCPRLNSTSLVPRRLPHPTRLIGSPAICPRRWRGWRAP